MEYVMPKDATSGEAMCIAEVTYIGNNSVKVKQIIWINMNLPFIKQRWEMLGERGLVVDLENDFYRAGDMYFQPGLIYDIFKSGLIK